MGENFARYLEATANNPNNPAAPNQYGKDVWRFGEVSSEFECNCNYGLVKCTYDYDLGFTFLPGSNNTIFRCLLCGDAEWKVMGSSNKRDHLGSSKHKKLVKELKLKQSSRIEQFKKLDKAKYKYDLQRLGFVPEPIKMLLVEWHIMGTSDEASKHKSENIIEEIERMCNWYQKQEPVVQLELVLWKNACLLNPPNGIDPVDYFVRRGWKKNKAARRDRMISIVIMNVIPFLNM